MSIEDVRQLVACEIGGTDPKTGHVYIDGNDACLLIADRLIAAGLVTVGGAA